MGTFHFVSIKHAYIRKDSSQVNNLKTLEKEQQIKPKTSKRKKIWIRAGISEIKKQKNREK